ncbi:MAG: CcmD family protein [Deltaproteobacteria bacterium]|nr:CcmD family protein [Deltaproteobacteria bacterium]
MTALRRLLLTVALTLLPLAQAMADEAYEDFTPQPLTDPKAPLHVVLSYSAIWMLILLFVVSVWRRQARVAAELKELEKQVRGEGGSPSAPHR